jgi:hypothetical protein
VLGDEEGRKVDVHVISFDGAGNGIYGPVENGWAYPAGCLTGKGKIDGYAVNCLTPEQLVTFHTGYKLDRNDFLDVRALCEKFNIEMPDEHKAYWRAKGPQGLCLGGVPVLTDSPSGRQFFSYTGSAPSTPQTKPNDKPEPA